jgi:AraC-like DNA-binding protein
MKDGSFSLMCKAAVHCTNLEHALKVIIKYFRAYLDDMTVCLQGTSITARVQLVQSPKVVCRPFAHETMLVMIHGLLCWLVGRRLPISCAGFAFPRPPHASEYAILFCADLRFDQASTFFELTPAFLKLPIVQNSNTAAIFLRSAPQNLLLKYKNTASLEARIRRKIKSSLPMELPTTESLARLLHITPATLYRRLKAEGKTYRTIRDELRRDLAVNYLASTKMDLQDVADATGFESVSAFHRAFRTWTGSSPSAFRRLRSREAPTSEWR